MNTFLTKVLTTGFIFLFIFLSGYGLHRDGKPYSVIFFTIHKLIGLGALVFVVVTAYQIHKITPLGSIEILAVAFTVLCFIATITSGGLVSLDRAVPVLIQRIHQVMPYLTVFSSASSLVLLLDDVHTLLTAVN